MPNRNRDDFTGLTKLQIAKRAGWLCSAPFCRRHTVGSTSDGHSEINVGVAAHICAAAPHGPRYDSFMTPDQRRSPDNGVWLCQDHAKVVDSNDPQFTVECLRQWKTQAQDDSWRRVLHDGIQPALAPAAPPERELGDRLRSAAASDIDVLRHSARWPSTGISLGSVAEKGEMTPQAKSQCSAEGKGLEGLPTQQPQAPTAAPNARDREHPLSGWIQLDACTGALFDRSSAPSRKRGTIRVPQRSLSGSHEHQTYGGVDSGRGVAR